MSNTQHRGRRRLTIENIEQLTDTDREHIAKSIIDGNRQGEVIQSEEDLKQHFAE